MGFKASRKALAILAVLHAAFFLALALAAPHAAQAHDYYYWHASAQQKAYPTTLRPLAFGRADPDWASKLPTMSVVVPQFDASGTVVATSSVVVQVPLSAPETPTIGAMTLTAARSEYEGRQLVLRTREDTLTDVWIEATPFTGRDIWGVPRTIPVDSIETFKVGYVYISTPSTGMRRKGWEPDPLLPMTLVNGQRLGWRPNGQPLNLDWRSIPPSTTQPFYVLFHVPDTATPGTYRTTLTVTARGADGVALPVVTVPVELRVYPFSIAKQTLLTSFGLSPRWLQTGNTANGRWLSQAWSVPPDSDRIVERYASHADQMVEWLRYMSQHRISPQTILPAWETGNDARPPDDNGQMAGRDAYLQDYLGTGSATTFAGERFNFNTVRMPEMETRPPYITNPFSSSSAFRSAALYYKTMWTELQPWISKAYVYVVDEPRFSQLDFVERYGYLSHTYAPGVKFMVTLDPSAFNYRAFINVDVYVERLHNWYRDYSKWVVPLRRWGREFWIYSHAGSLQGQTPNYLIDKPLADARVQGWFAYDTKASGLMYYSLNRWAAPRLGTSEYRDPYTKPLSMRLASNGKTVWANGDGSLIYPGYYPAIGMTIQGAPPVGSLRMEALRDGLEDYEYLKLLEARAGASAVKPFVKQIIGAPKTVVVKGRPTFPAYPTAAVSYERARDAVAGAIGR